MSGFIFSARIPAQMPLWLSGLKEQIYITLVKNGAYKQYLNGLGVTLLLAAVAIVLGTLIGTFTASTIYYSKQTGKAKPLQMILRTYVTVVRGTPITVQLFIAYFVVFSTMKSGMVAAFVAFGLNSGAYVSEIIRAGLESIDRGQMEAGRALGLNRKQTMRKIIIPQTVKVILPAIGNEFVVLIKETSVVGFISVMDLSYVQTIQAGASGNYEFSLFMVAGIYLILVLGISKLLSKFERRLKRSDSR